jgi:hypothetical protein
LYEKGVVQAAFNPEHSSYWRRRHTDFGWRKQEKAHRITSRSVSGLNEPRADSDSSYVRELMRKPTVRLNQELSSGINLSIGQQGLTYANSCSCWRVQFVSTTSPYLNPLTPSVLRKTSDFNFTTIIAPVTNSPCLLVLSARPTFQTGRLFSGSRNTDGSTLCGENQAATVGSTPSEATRKEELTCESISMAGTRSRS